MDWAFSVGQWTVRLATAYLLRCPTVPSCPALTCPSTPACPACPGAPQAADEPLPASGSLGLLWAVLLLVAFSGGGVVASICHWWQDCRASDLAAEARRQVAVVKGRRGV